MLASVDFSNINYGKAAQDAFQTVFGTMKSVADMQRQKKMQDLLLPLEMRKTETEIAVMEANAARTTALTEATRQRARQEAEAYGGYTEAMSQPNPFMPRWNSMGGSSSEGTDFGQGNFLIDDYVGPLPTKDGEGPLTPLMKPQGVVFDGLGERGELRSYQEIRKDKAPGLRDRVAGESPIPTGGPVRSERTDIIGGGLENVSLESGGIDDMQDEAAVGGIFSDLSDIYAADKSKRASVLNGKPKPPQRSAFADVSRDFESQKANYQSALRSARAARNNQEVARIEAQWGEAQQTFMQDFYYAAEEDIQKQGLVEDYVASGIGDPVAFMQAVGKNRDRQVVGIGGSRGTSSSDEAFSPRANQIIQEQKTLLELIRNPEIPNDAREQYRARLDQTKRELLVEQGRADAAQASTPAWVAEYQTLEQEAAPLRRDLKNDLIEKGDKKRLEELALQQYTLITRNAADVDNADAMEKFMRGEMNTPYAFVKGNFVELVTERGVPKLRLLTQKGKSPQHSWGQPARDKDGRQQFVTPSFEDIAENENKEPPSPGFMESAKEEFVPVSEGLGAKIVKAPAKLVKGFEQWSISHWERELSKELEKIDSLKEEMKTDNLSAERRRRLSVDHNSRVAKAEAIREAVKAAKARTNQ